MNSLRVPGIVARCDELLDRGRSPGREQVKGRPRVDAGPAIGDIPEVDLRRRQHGDQVVGEFRNVGRRRDDAVPGAAHDVANAVGVLHIRHHLAPGPAVPGVRTRDARGAQQALDLRRARILSQRADIAPREGGDGVSREEVVPGLGKVPTDLGGTARARQLDEVLECGDMARLVDERCHVGGIKPEQVVVLVDLHRIVAGARLHDERCGKRHEVEEPEAATLQVKADAVVGIAVAVPVLAVKKAGDRHQLLPGRGFGRHILARLLLEGLLPFGVVEDVLAEVQELRVSVIDGAVPLAVPGHQRLDARGDSVPVPGRIGRIVEEALQRLNPSALDVVAVEPGPRGQHVVGVLAGGKIGDGARQEVAERQLDDLQGRAGRLLESLAPEEERSRDAASSTAAQHAHRDRLPGKPVPPVRQVAVDQRFIGGGTLQLVLCAGEELLRRHALERVRRHGTRHRHNERRSPDPHDFHRCSSLGLNRNGSEHRVEARIPFSPTQSFTVHKRCLIPSRHFLPSLKRFLQRTNMGKASGALPARSKGVGRHYTPFWRGKARKSATFRAEKSSN